jgi:hypothetical protein
VVNVQELIQKELLESKSEENEMLQLLEFMRDNGTPLTPQQAAAAYLLQQNGLNDIPNFVFNVRKMMTPTQKIFKFIDKFTLADRIKGNAKLSNILKANAQQGNMPSINTSMNPERAGR